MPELEEKIKYGYTHDLSRMPTGWFRSYDEAVRCAKHDQPANRPYYMIELCEHYEVCGRVEENGDEWLVSMPNNASTHIYIKRGEKDGEEI